MPMRARLRPVFNQNHSNAREAAGAYDAVSERYLAYADGDHADLFDFRGSHAFADKEIWARLDAFLVELRTSGRHAIRILDAGCGPGTWLLRLAIRARDLGFTAIEARGFDISPEMIALAHHRLALVDDPHIGIRFELGDIVTELDQEDDGCYDLVVCLYGVLNHLTAAEREAAAAAIARVTDGDALVTVRAAGSPPSIYVAALGEAKGFHQDHERDRLDVDLADGHHISFNSHLFTARELRALFEQRMAIAEMAGVDLFHGRFAPDPHWNPAGVGDGAADEGLERLEHLCAHDPAFIDRATHLLLHARSRDQAA